MNPIPSDSCWIGFAGGGSIWKELGIFACFPLFPFAFLVGWIPPFDEREEEEVRRSTTKTPEKRRE